jgi:hypothetical protein
MEPSPSGRAGEAVFAKRDGVPDRAQLREAIQGRARDLSNAWRDAWRQNWTQTQSKKRE